MIRGETIAALDAQAALYPGLARTHGQVVRGVALADRAPFVPLTMVAALERQLKRGDKRWSATRDIVAF